MTTKQKVHIDRTPQLDIFARALQSKEDSKPAVLSQSPQRRFTAPDSEAIYLGNTSLKNHLELAGQKTPIIIGTLLKEQDWSAFEALYD